MCNIEVQVMPEVVARVHSLLAEGWDWSKAATGPVAGSSEESREQAELERAYLQLLHVLLHNQLSLSLMQVLRN